MEPETFLGNALNGVDGKGRLSVPSFVRSQLDRSSDARIVMIGVHETKPCLTVYGAQYAAFMLADFERRLLKVEESGGDLDEMHDRAAGMFGSTERLSYDSSGRIVLPKTLRSSAQIDDLVHDLRVRVRFHSIIDVSGGKRLLKSVVGCADDVEVDNKARSDRERVIQNGVHEDVVHWLRNLLLKSLNN